MKNPRRFYEQNVEVPPPMGYTGKWVQTNAQADTASQGSAGIEDGMPHPSISTRRQVGLAVKQRERRL